MRTASMILGCTALAIALTPAGAAAEMRDYSCAPTAVKVDEKRIEILCEQPIVLSDRSSDPFREVDRFAFPMISQNYQPQLGSQVKLLDYYLDLAQNAVIHSRKLHVWFETDYSRSSVYGCDPANCRAIVALALTYAPAISPPPQADPTDDL